MPKLGTAELLLDPALRAALDAGLGWWGRRGKLRHHAIQDRLWHCSHAGVSNGTEQVGPELWLIYRLLAHPE
jgi:hypothetical protein